MTSGGRRNRSGPTPNERSARSDSRGFSLTALPAEGYKGPVPEFPLPLRFPEESEHSAAIDKRERELWVWLWKTPQACAWSMPSESWRLHTIAMYVRTFVICEGADAKAADKAALHRFADQIGMTTAGLTEMGWKVAVDEVSEKRTEAHDDDESDGEKPKRQRRLRSVPEEGTG